MKANWISLLMCLMGCATGGGAQAVNEDLDLGVPGANPTGRADGVDGLIHEGGLVLSDGRIRDQLVHDVFGGAAYELSLKQGATLELSTTRQDRSMKGFVFGPKGPNGYPTEPSAELDFGDEPAVISTVDAGAYRLVVLSENNLASREAMDDGVYEFQIRCTSSECWDLRTFSTGALATEAPSRILIEDVFAQDLSARVADAYSIDLRANQDVLLEVTGHGSPIDTMLFVVPPGDDAPVTVSDNRGWNDPTSFLRFRPETSGFHTLVITSRENFDSGRALSDDYYAVAVFCEEDDPAACGPLAAE